MACQLSEQAEIRTARTEVFLQRPDWWNGAYDTIFADPPYAKMQAADLLQQVWTIGLLSSNGVMVIEQDVKADLPRTLDQAVLVKRYVYGDTALFLYGPAPSKAVSA